MMRNSEQTIGNLIDKQGVSFIGSVDADGFPNIHDFSPKERAKNGVQNAPPLSCGL